MWQVCEGSTAHGGLSTAELNCMLRSRDCQNGAEAHSICSRGGSSPAGSQSTSCTS